MHKKTKWGIFALVAPLSSLALILLLWSLLSFIAGQMIYAAGEEKIMTLFNLFNVVLGFFGIISVVSLPIGLIVGIMLIVDGEDQKNSVLQTQNSDDNLNHTSQDDANS